MNKLIVAVFKNLIAVDVFEVEVGVKLKPFLVFPFVLDLRMSKNVPLFR